MENNKMVNKGIYDIKGKNKNPLTGENYKNLYETKTFTLDGEKIPRTYANLAKRWSTFKVYEQRKEIVKSIKDNQITLVKAGTGVGKTVLLPKFALHAVDYKEKVVTTIPKRIITKESADFAAQTLDVKLGEEVGYYYSGTNKVSSKTKLIYTTPGSLISKLTGNDPLLNEYKVIVIDEAHERSIEIDMLLMLLKNALQQRKDLRVVIMSATIDLSIFANYFSKGKNNFLTIGKIDVGSATTYPITSIYSDKSITNWKSAAVKTLMYILTETAKGDILVFARSAADGIAICQLLAGEINSYNKKQVSQKRKMIVGGETKNIIEIKKATKNIADYLSPYCTQLASGVSKEQSDLAIDETEYLRVFNGKFNRKIVVSTNVAESSLTVEGVVYVVDTGLEYTEAYYPEYKANSLLESVISKANVKQRKGRAGRTQPGTCFHLYTEEEYKKFDDYPKPDIIKTDLTSQILNLMRLPNVNTVGDVTTMLNDLITPPEPIFVRDALLNLYYLGCITSEGNNGVLTGLGIELSKYRKIPIYYGRMIMAAHKYKCLRDVIKVVGMLNELRGQIDNLLIPFSPSAKLSTAENKKAHQKYLDIKDKYKNNYSDLIALLRIYNDWEKNGMNRKWCVENYMNYSLLKRVSRNLSNLFVKHNYSNIAMNFVNLEDKKDKLNFNKFVFENRIKLGDTATTYDKILMCSYIGLLPLTIFKAKANNYLSCNAEKNKNIQIDHKNFVVRNSVKLQVVPIDIMWLNLNSPLKVSLFSNVSPKLERHFNYMLKELNMECTSNKIKLKIDLVDFKPNYTRL